MASTLTEAVEALKYARRLAAEKRLARKDAEAKATEAVKEDREAATAEDNARTRLNAVIAGMTDPGEVK